MSHKEQREFLSNVANMFPSHFNNCRVLEIGSNDINGTVRSNFRNCEYTGIDVAEGEGVDIVAQGQDYHAPENSFDTVISSECFEHNPHWKATFMNMYRLCRLGGLIVVTCAATGRPEHGTPRSSAESSKLSVELGWDYYRNLTQKDFVAAMDLNNAFSEFVLLQDWDIFDLYFIGIKRNHGNHKSKRAIRAFEELRSMMRNKNNSIKISLKKLLAIMLGDRGFSVIRLVRHRGKHPQTKRPIEP